MSGPSLADCAEALQVLIAAADSRGFGAAQNLLLRFALAHDDPARRGQAMDALQAALAPDASDEAAADRAGLPQRAFHAALVAMIERTKLTVGPNDGRNRAEPTS